MTLTERIKQKAVELGFDRVGVAPARRARHAAAYRAWLEAGHHGEMDWLARAPERREDVRALVPGALSVIGLGMSYYVGDPDPMVWNDPLRGRIARYAWGADYHHEIEPLLKALCAFIEQEVGRSFRRRYYVDTGPVLEREIARDAGLGFIGKNSLLIDPQQGSYLFLAEIITDLELEPDDPFPEESAGAVSPDRPMGTCGQCRRCLDVCPTHAFPVPYVVNSRRCISYLTIELKGSIPEALRPKMKNWIYGCDACQEVCPWVRRYAKVGEHRFLAYDPDRVAPYLTELMRMDDEAFLRRFRDTPVRRTKRRGLLRNVAVALGNSGDRSVIPVLTDALKDPEPLIREHAAWAIRQLTEA